MKVQPDEDNKMEDPALTTNSRLRVRTGTTVLNGEREAVRDLFDQVNQQDMEAVIFFCSSRYDLDRLGKELKNAFPCPLIGCTTAGEISSGGYQEGGMVGVSLSSAELRLHSRLISPLKLFGHLEAQELAESIQGELVFSDRFEKDKHFGFLLIDGMSKLEDQVIATLFNQFEGLSIAGGSAGDDLRFAETKIYSDGRFLSDAALFTLFETTLPFLVFQTQHFRPTDRKLVITGADPSRRIVTEINAGPAAQEYADMLGLSLKDLGPAVFSTYPPMLKIGDRWYVRSIQKANEDGSLSFYCAIDVGLVLTLARGEDLVSQLKDELDDISRKIPDVELVIGCDCILRKLEIAEKGLIGAVENLLGKFNFIGFSTYGEQFNSIHVNQTLTGVVIGG
jgi:hypothetical protein